MGDEDLQSDRKAAVLLHPLSRRGQLGGQVVTARGPGAVPRAVPHEPRLDPEMNGKWKIFATKTWQTLENRVIK